jgi:hypothetical protein
MKKNNIYSASQDISYLQAALPVLKEFLFSNQIRWPLTGLKSVGNLPLPDLSMGSLLLAARRLAGTSKTEEETKTIQVLLSELEDIRTKWHSTWEAKCFKEIQSRIKIWVQDIKRLDPAELVNWPAQVRSRVIIEILRSEINQESQLSPDLFLQLAASDMRLKQKFTRGEFVWDERLKETFPQDPFWYLYGTIKESQG